MEPDLELRLECIGVCEDCGWFFRVSEFTPEEDATCPKPGCEAGVMIFPRAPKLLPEPTASRRLGESLRAFLARDMNRQLTESPAWKDLIAAGRVLENDAWREIHGSP
jgi:hypothetical protein